MYFKNCAVLLFSVFFIFGEMVCSDKSSTEPDHKTGPVKLEEIDDVLPNPFKGLAPWIGDDNRVYNTKSQQATFAWRDLEQTIPNCPGGIRVADTGVNNYENL